MLDRCRKENRLLKCKERSDLMEKKKKREKKKRRGLNACVKKSVASMQRKVRSAQGEITTTHTSEREREGNKMFDSANC